MTRSRCAHFLFIWLCAIPICPIAAQEDINDVLGGFEDEDPAFEVSDRETEDDERIWDLSGSIEVSGSVNVRSHDSATGTNYSGLQRLRTRLNLGLDVDLPEAWKLRAEGWGFIDLAYALRGRDEYTRDVLDAYETDAEFGELWLQGSLFENVDVKAGRQIVIWGRSETLRVLDILNPIDNREVARVDLEDLRRPVGMLKLDTYFGDWSLSAIAIPEVRFDSNPVPGSDFFPGVFEPPSDEPEDWEDLELAAALNGIFSGWDISVHAAWFWNDQARFARRGAPSLLVHDRLWMLGAGGNFTTGSWLFKLEGALLDGLGFFSERGDKSRLDLFGGVEYYGFVDTTLVLEITNRHLFEYDERMRRGVDFVREDSQEVAVRVSRNFMNDRLHATFVGVLLNWNGKDGSIARLQVDYDIQDALTAGIGILLYQAGDRPPLDRFGRNDRVTFNVKWSF